MRRAGRVLRNVAGGLGLIAAIAFLFAGYTASHGVLLTSKTVVAYAAPQGRVTLVAAAQGLYGQEVAIAGWITLVVTIVITAGTFVLRSRPGAAGGLMIVGGGAVIFLLPSPLTLIAALLWIVGGILTIVGYRREISAQIAAEE